MCNTSSNKGFAQTLTGGTDIVTSNVVHVNYIMFCNKTGTERTVDVQNSAGVYFCKALAIPNDGIPVHFPLPEGGLEFAGMKLTASAASAIEAWVSYRHN